MTRLGFAAVVLFAFAFGTGIHAQAAKTDIIPTSQGQLTLTLIGHGTLMFEHGGKIIHVDPWAQAGSFASLPKADLVLITHHHRDHLDSAALAQITQDSTMIVMPPKCFERVNGMDRAPILMVNGDKRIVAGFPIEAVPAYNLVHKREGGVPFHPRGEGNGYIITFKDTRVYVAGDTENTPEMKSLKGIDAAFIPMNLPYTMDSAMAADAVKAFTPKWVYPYHTRSNAGDQVPGFIKLMTGWDEITVRDLR